MKKRQILGFLLGIVTLTSVSVVASPTGVTLSKPEEHHSHRSGISDTGLSACTTYFTKSGTTLKAKNHTTYVRIEKNDGTLLKSGSKFGTGTSETNKITADENPLRTFRRSWYQ